MFAVPEHTVLRPASHPHRRGIAELVRSAAAAAESWTAQLHWGPGRPAQLSLPVPEPGAEVWLSGWQPGLVTRDHTHPAAQGAFTVVSGLIVEHASGVSRTLRPGQVRVFGPGYRHELLNPGPGAAVTVHVQLG